MFFVTRIQQIISLVTAVTAFVIAVRELKHAVAGFKKKDQEDKLNSAVIEHPAISAGPDASATAS
ncbi:MAG: hypothetical protein K2X77_04885 [Candidatus Obscuribacterales bacterium]|jgi:hypothetical protein|nr:hypothetical protein [Candidatus Obscuribacterales bacterium]